MKNKSGAKKQNKKRTRSDQQVSVKYSSSYHSVSV